MTKGKPQGKTLTGIISVNRRGVGYVTTEGQENDVEVDPDRLNTALHGDTVEVVLLPKQGSKRQQGEIESVILRSKTEFVGVLEKANGHYSLKADDRRLYRDILIPEREIQGKNIKERTKALIHLKDWSDPKKNPEGEIVQIIGPAGVHETEMQAIVLSQGFDTSFPKDVEKEAEEIGKKRNISQDEIDRRLDLRKVTTFTIDPDDAKDFDDAISIRQTDNGNWEIGVHIADVSHYVRPGSDIDEEAQERGTSIYLVDRTIPMLPEALSNDVCSLNPNEDKLTYSAVFEIDKQGGVVKNWFGSTVIHSDKRFTYEEAQKILDAKAGKFYEELNTLNTLAKKMRGQRAKAGGISFEQDEVKFRLDKEGKPLEVFKKKRLDTHMLVEDFMLLANREIAKYFYDLCKKQGLRESLFIYRIHDVPNADKLEELSIFLRAIGYDFEVKNGEVSGEEINELFKQIDGKPEEQLIKTAAIRSMAKAVYSTKNIGHFGLAFKYYTHFTSPIRRYPDVMVHRIMKNALGGDKLTKPELKSYERLTIQSSQRELDAVSAERESIKYKQVEFMKDKIGQTFDGIIVGVVEWGLYVEEANTRADGLVRVKNLGDDYYNFESKKYRLVGEKKKNSYSLGDKVKIKLIDANLEERTLEWVLV